MSKSVSFSSAAIWVMRALISAWVFSGEYGIEGHRDKHGLRLILAEAGEEFVKILGEVGCEVFALRLIVEAVSDEDVIQTGALGSRFVVSTAVDQPADEFTADAFV